MNYLSPLISAMQDHDLGPITSGLEKLVVPFDYLSSLKPGENLQPTTWGRAWITRPLTMMDQCEVQKTFSLGIGLYPALSGAYSQESFDKVVEFYTGEMHKAKSLFEDAIQVISLYNEIKADKDAKLKLLRIGKSAFWHVAVSCQGLHTWAKTLAATFQTEEEVKDHRIKSINGLLLQQNAVICKIFKSCLQHFPKAMHALADQVELNIEKASFLTDSVEQKDPLLCMKEALHAGRAAGECVKVTRNFIFNLRKYYPELVAHEESALYEERMQIKAFKSLMAKGEEILDILSVLPEEEAYAAGDLTLIEETVKVLHRLFAEPNAVGHGFIAELIKATIDIDLKKRGRIQDILEKGEVKFFPESKTALWQVLAMQMITSRFVMPLSEVFKNAKEHPGLVHSAAMLKYLYDVFLVAADLTNKSHS